MLHLCASLRQVPHREIGAAKISGILGAIKLDFNSWAPGKLANSADQNKLQAIRRNAAGARD
jgi:hypothetical protein